MVEDRIQQATLEEADKLEIIVQRRNVELQQLQAQEVRVVAFGSADSFVRCSRSM